MDTVCKRFLELLPKFQWFITKYFGQEEIDKCKTYAERGEELCLLNELNSIWYYLPDNIFNIKENPEGWNEFLSLLEE